MLICRCGALVMWSPMPQPQLQHKNDGTGEQYAYPNEKQACGFIHTPRSILEQSASCHRVWHKGGRTPASFLGLE